MQCRIAIELCRAMDALARGTFVRVETGYVDPLAVARVRAPAVPRVGRRGRKRPVLCSSKQSRIASRPEIARATERPWVEQHFVGEVLQFVAEPMVDRDAKAHFRARRIASAGGRRRPLAGSICRGRDGLLTSAACRCQFHDAVIEQRLSAFQAVGHRGDIDLGHQIARQIGHQIEQATAAVTRSRPCTLPKAASRKRNGSVSGRAARKSSL